MHEIDGEIYLTADEVIALLGIKRATLYAYVSRGVLQSFRKGIGRERLYRRADVEALLAVRADAPSPRQVAEPPAPYTPEPATAPPPPADDDRTQRNVSLPPVETWAGDH
jgi:citrate synthase